MSQFKEDIKDAKERLKAWWDHELIDRPCISYWYPYIGEKIPDFDVVLEFFDPFYLCEYWDDVDTALDNFESFCKKLYFGGESIPRFNPYYGPGIMASVLGIVPKFQTRTVWFQRETKLDEIVPLLESIELNTNNEWYARLLRTTEIAAKRGRNDYCIAIQDMGGVLDILSSFLGPTKLILTMRRDPELIDTCRAIILEKMMKVFDELFKIMGKYSDGYSSWMNIWCPKPWIPIQCDFSAFLSPKWFKRFALPDIIAQAEHVDYSIYHLDGPDAFKHLDDILEIDAINGVQWVPGAGNELKCSDAWMSAYKKIQNANKNVVIDYFELPERLVHFYNELNPKGLFTTTIFMDYYRAKFYTPKFIGGEDSKGNFREFKKNYRKKLKVQKFL